LLQKQQEYVSSAFVSSTTKQFPTVGVPALPGDLARLPGAQERQRAGADAPGVGQPATAAALAACRHRPGAHPRAAHHAAHAARGAAAGRRTRPHAGARKLCIFPSPSFSVED